MDRWAKIPETEAHYTDYIVVATYFHDSMQNISADIQKSVLKASQNQMEKVRNKIYSDLRKISHLSFKSFVILALNIYIYI